MYDGVCVVLAAQIHNWATDLSNDAVPSLEFVAPAKVYVVCDGIKFNIDLQRVPVGGKASPCLRQH